MRLSAALVLASLCLLPVSVSAHAIVIASSPEAGAVLKGSVIRVRLRFNSRLDATRSRLMLVRSDGSTMPIELTDSDSPAILEGRVSDVAPGSYRLRWQVLAIDGHITRGDIPFSVAP